MELRGRAEARPRNSIQNFAAAGSRKAPFEIASKQRMPYNADISSIYLIEIFQFFDSTCFIH
jgi:hypothetical protein